MHLGAVGKGEDFSADVMRAAHDLAAPADPIVASVFSYWDRKRGTRRMPSRRDIDPADLGTLLPHVMLYDVVAPENDFRVRLVGGAIVSFYGINTTGEMATSRMTPNSAAMMIAILRSVVECRAPRFRAGLAHWHRDKSYRSFEACFLPLSPDDDRVDKIFTAIAFDTSAGATRSGP
jgi:hypothetical protein